MYQPPRDLAEIDADLVCSERRDDAAATRGAFIMAKYQAYAEYKDSGVEWLGEIPSHWKLASFTISSGKHVK